MWNCNQMLGTSNKFALSDGLTTLFNAIDKRFAFSTLSFPLKCVFYQQHSALQRPFHSLSEWRLIFQRFFSFILNLLFTIRWKLKKKLKRMLAKHKQRPSVEWICLEYREPFAFKITHWNNHFEWELVRDSGVEIQAMHLALELHK